MNAARRHDILTDLRAVVCAQELGTRPSGSLPSLPFGVAEIDAALPAGGLALGAVHEVLGGGADLGQGGLAALWIGGILARTSGPVIWVYSRRDLDARITPNLAREWSASQPADWANESHRIAQKVGYGMLSTMPSVGTRPEPEEITTAYSKAATEAIELRLEQAGIRLAKVLNDSLR